MHFLPSFLQVTLSVVQTYINHTVTCLESMEVLDGCSVDILQFISRADSCVRPNVIVEWDCRVLIVDMQDGFDPEARSSNLRL